MATFRGRRVYRGEGNNNTPLPPYTNDKMGQIDYEYPHVTVSGITQNDAIKQNHLLEQSVTDPFFRAGISSIMRYPTARFSPREGWNQDHS